MSDLCLCVYYIIICFLFFKNGRKKTGIQEKLTENLTQIRVYTRIKQDINSSSTVLSTSRQTVQDERSFQHFAY